MAAGSGIEEISPGQVIPAEVAGRDRALRGSLAESAELYARAVLAEDWRVLGFGSLEAWQADVLGSARLAVEARQKIAEQLSAAGKTAREIAPRPPRRAPSLGALHPPRSLSTTTSPSYRAP